MKFLQMAIMKSEEKIIKTEGEGKWYYQRKIKNILIVYPMNNY